MARAHSVSVVAPALVALVVFAGCSSDDPAGDSSGSPDQDAAVTTFEPQLPTEVAVPPAEGAGISMPQPAAAVPEGYVLEEFLVGGTATSFDAVDTPDDGEWVVDAAEEAEYRTRVVVRRPVDEADFSGTVIVEWFNVSAIEAAPDWGYVSEELAREGHAYVGVSAQAQGIEGGETLLDVEVDAEQADQADVSTDKSGLRNVDPERYGTLSHPGDAYAYDIFSQIGRLVDASPEQLLGNLRPESVIAVGESQSAMFMTPLINAVHPIAPSFDGFLVHSRGGTVPAIDGTYTSSREAREQGEVDPVLIRTDTDVPVMVFEPETDLTLLGYSQARQPDTDTIHVWEVAGTSHADAQTLRAVIGGPRDPGIGSLLGCESINTGPHKEVLQAAVHHLVGWVGGGEPPPAGERLELTESGDEPAEITRDERGNALGGVRNPLVDAPVAALSGDPAPDVDDESVCLLFGTTRPFDRTALLEIYGDADTYVQRFRDSAAEAVAGGFLLQPDADALIAEAEANRTLFG